MANEYERRFLLERVPTTFDWAYVKVIRQVYWDLGNKWSLRLRRQGEGDAPDDILALKGPRYGSFRLEFEARLSELLPDPEDSNQLAVELYRAGATRQVVKTRRGAVIDGVLWDIDEFHLANEGLIIAEVEMKDQDKLNQLSRPAWALREVTLEPEYNNEELARQPYKRWKD